ncbi:hypothetical protein NQ318_011862 [Aromia moschata]|uniref:ADAMTS/ADAMTS-like Spacer 1 domain-containing protein n=1 Tax=Aromia moschata TaxID=1265417 RepID=A0AAV8XJ09_9CUCU|nr:hypothetical protein NQ318_011862 [Aromia moschata]
MYSVGCDWVVDSTAKEDDCGICQGDGTKCDKKEGLYNKQSRSPGYREIVVIPRGARNIRVEEKGYSENYISVGSAMAKKFYLNGKRHITLPGEYTVAGSQALYERDNQLEKIRIPGPILEPIVVYLCYKGKTHNPGVEYKYSIWKPETTKQVKYSWILGDWSQCSATCGGGVQQRPPVCQESTVSTVASELETPAIVDDLMCEPSERPQQLMRTCNDDPCPYNWWVGPWQACPVTCANKAVNQHYYIEVLTALRKRVRRRRPDLWKTKSWKIHQDNAHSALSVKAFFAKYGITVLEPPPYSPDLARGTQPMKRRSVMCVDGQEMALPDHYCDKNVKPLEFQTCRILPPCEEDDR